MKEFPGTKEIREVSSVRVSIRISRAFARRLHFKPIVCARNENEARSRFLMNIPSRAGRREITSAASRFLYGEAH